MPPQKRITLPDDVREAFEERLVHSKKISDQAVEDFYIDIYLMHRSGMTIAEIAGVLGESTSTVGDWKKKGEQARNRRRGEGPHRPGELAANGV